MSDAKTEGVAGRVAQDAGAFGAGLVVFLGGIEPDRLLCGGVEVVDGEVQVDLLQAVLGRPCRCPVALDTHGTN